MVLLFVLAGANLINKQGFICVIICVMIYSSRSTRMLHYSVMTPHIIHPLSVFFLPDNTNKLLTSDF